MERYGFGANRMDAIRRRSIRNDERINLTMGLDILIESKTSNQQIHLSRQFCREMIDKSEHKEAVLNQLFAFFEIDSLLIDRMNVWPLEQKFWARSSNLTKTAIDEYYQQAWQDAKLVAEQLPILIDKMEKDRKFFAHLAYKNEQQKEYYRKVNQQINGDKDRIFFKDDLQALVIFLDTLPAKERVKFHYF